MKKQSIKIAIIAALAANMGTSLQASINVIPAENSNKTIPSCFPDSDKEKRSVADEIRAANQQSRKEFAQTILWAKIGSKFSLLSAQAKKQYAELQRMLTDRNTIIGNK